MALLATTNRGLESAAVREIQRLTDRAATVHHPGWVAFEGDSDAIVTLNARARTLHRVFVQLVDTTIDAIEDIAPLVESVDWPAYLDAEQSFGVDSTRIGTHDFGSPDVADVVGQAVIDGFRERTGHRLPVDLDDPEVRLRATVRHDRFTLALDTTGAASLHQRPYRVRGHAAPIRPTLAAAMLELLGYEGQRSLADPFCGCGTIPVEAALRATGRSPNAERDNFAFQRLRFVPDDMLARVRAETPTQTTPSILASDHDAESVAATRANAASAGVDVGVYRGDASQYVPDADVVVTDLPFNIRTNHGDLRPLYRGFVEAIEASSCDRLAALTTRPNLLPLEPAESITFRDGRLDVTIVLASV